MSARPSPSPRPTTVHTVTPLPGHLTHQIGKDGYLESYTLGVVLLSLAGAVAVAWVASALLHRRRGRRLVPRLPVWGVAVGNGTAVVLLLLTGLLVMINNYVGYVPTLSALLHPPGMAAPALLHRLSDTSGSRVLRLDIRDRRAGIATGTTYVYLPPGYSRASQAATRYPTVYLLHGYPGRPQDWFTAGEVRSTMDLLLRDHYIGPMIVVSPTASTGYLNDDECLNAPGHFALEHYLAFTVVDTIDRTFRTYRDRSHRAIGGMSSGGFCALNIGLHHLHRYSVILASEPYGDPGLHPLHRVLADNWGLWRANSPSFYIPLWQFSLPVAAFLDSGGFDTHTTTNALRLAQQLAARGQEASYRPAPHQHHTWREARMALPYALIFAWQHFGRLPNGGSDHADAAELRRVLAYAESLPPPRPRAGAASPSPSGTRATPRRRHSSASPTGTPATPPRSPTSTGPSPSRRPTASPSPSV